MDAESLLKRLSEKYGSPLSLLDALKRQYGAVPVRGGPCAPDRPSDGYEVENPLVFTEDASENKEKLGRILQGYAEMKREILSLAGESSRNYEKLLEQYREKVETFSRNNWKGEKLAGEFQKILKRTLLKLWSDKEERSPRNLCLRRYFHSCGIRSMDYEAGHRLSDDDLGYLDTETTQAYTISTDLEEQNYKVSRMIRPVFLIGYQEEGEERQETCVEGICSYYVRKR